MANTCPVSPENHWIVRLQEPSSCLFWPHWTRKKTKIHRQRVHWHHVCNSVVTPAGNPVYFSSSLKPLLHWETNRDFFSWKLHTQSYSMWGGKRAAFRVRDGHDPTLAKVCFEDLPLLARWKTTSSFHLTKRFLWTTAKLCMKSSKSKWNVELKDKLMLVPKNWKSCIERKVFKNFMKIPIMKTIMTF